MPTKIDPSQMLQFFSGDLSFAEIGRRIRRSRERVRQLYKPVADLFPDRPNGRSRQKICTLRTNLQKAQDFSNAPTVLRKIAEIAQAHGYPVRKIPLSKSGNSVITFYTTSIRINGRVCTIHHLKNIGSLIPHCKSTYTCLKLTRTKVEKCDFMIVLRQIGTTEQVFVVPTKILLGNWGYGYFHIRVQKISAHPNSHTRIDFWQYLDAWHLLTG